MHHSTASSVIQKKVGLLTKEQLRQHKNMEASSQEQCTESTLSSMHGEIQEATSEISRQVDNKTKTKQKPKKKTEKKTQRQK